MVLMRLAHSLSAADVEVGSRYVRGLVRGEKRNGGRRLLRRPHAG